MGLRWCLDSTFRVLDMFEGAAIPFGQIGCGTIRRLQEFEQRVIRRFRLSFLPNFVLQLSDKSVE